MIEQLSSVPWYAWGALLLVVFFIFRDKKRWSYKAHLEQESCRGDVTISHYHRTKPQIDVEVRLSEAYQGKAVYVFMDDIEVAMIPASKNQRKKINMRREYVAERPKHGSEVSLSVDGETIASGTLRSK